MRIRSDAVFSADSIAMSGFIASTELIAWYCLRSLALRFLNQLSAFHILENQLHFERQPLTMLLNKIPQWFVRNLLHLLRLLQVL
jgi:hypothetical protein